jgi:predicted transcriptional regulator
MNFSPNILISIHTRHLENMLAGHKTVELRRRALRVVPGTRVWIYCTHPTSQVRAVATIKIILTAPPIEIWDQYGARSGLLKTEFDSYFDKAQIGCAIVLSDIRRLSSPLALATIRKSVKRFQPPQFFKRLTPNCPEFSLLRKAHPQAKTGKEQFMDEIRE